MNCLYLVSTGPGDTELMTPRALMAIRQSSDIVAYGLYADLLGDLCQGKKRHDLPLGEETARAQLALDLAAEGKTVSLLSSGDIGIYAMASLVFELLDPQTQNRSQHPEWLDVDVVVIPGVSAMQAGSSVVGALLGHDFCTISLSDLLTPWEVIRKRIESAAEGDFVISFYNPVSKKRDWQLDQARDILLQHRPADTPVLLGRQLTRPEQSVRIVPLHELCASEVDMFTLVSVGNRETRQFVHAGKTRVYTPRGYTRKL